MVVGHRKVALVLVYCVVSFHNRCFDIRFMFLTGGNFVGFGVNCVSL